MALSDADGIVVDANPAYYHLYGYAPAEILGHSFAVIFPAELRAQVEAQYRELFNHPDPPPTVESDVRCKDGSARRVEVRYTFLTDPAGQRTAMLSVIRDVTERTHVDDLRARLAAIVESSEDAIVSKDLNGIIQTWNAGAERLFGYTATEAVGQPITLVIPPDRLDEEPEILRRIRRGERVEHFDTVRRRKDGTLLDISLTISPIVDRHGTIVGASKIARDITERRALERQKDAFIGIAAHELRTPLTGIKAYTQLLARRLRRAEVDSALDTLATLDRQVDRLTGLITDLLDVTRLESGTLPFRPIPFDLDALLAEVIDEVQPTTQHRIEAEFAATVTVVADRNRIAQVVTNLLTNAIKYSPHADRVIVRSTAVAGTVVVTVRDFGIGIPEDEQPQVFERFYRVTGQDRQEYSGLGLGLYIAAEFVKRHGGTIWVEPTDGKGTAIAFSLPRGAVTEGHADGLHQGR